MSKRILIVDNSPVVRKAIRAVLRQRGWEVSGEAGNGLEGIEKAKQLKPDVIVLDLSMPVMNGLEAARELTRILPSVPLLMFTNFESVQLTKEAMSAGIRKVVPKSAASALVNGIEELLLERES
jgi:two-component system chemotaxis response regulator CheY